MEKVNLQEKFALFHDHWRPRILGEVNDCQVKAAKLLGTFEWHHHEQEDEMFLVIEGQLTIKFRDRDIVLNPGEFLIIPRGVEHLPVADEEVHLLLFEPKTTLNTGTLESDRTVRSLPRI